MLISPEFDVLLCSPSALIQRVRHFQLFARFVGPSEVRQNLRQLLVGSRTWLVANQMAILVTYLPSLLLSNFVFPQENMPIVLKMVSFVVPATYYIDILIGLYLRNLAFNQLWPSYLVLAVMSILLVFLNIAVLKKEGF